MLRLPGAIQPIADRAKVARPPAPQRQPPERAGKIGAPFQGGAQRRADGALFQQILDRIETRSNGGGVRERTCKRAGERACARARYGPVECMEQAAAPLAMYIAHQLQIGPCRGVDHQHIAWAHALGGAQQRQLSDLRQLDIFEQCARGGEFGPGKVSECGNFHHAEFFLQCPLAPERVEIGARDGGQRRPDLIGEGADFRVGGQFIPGDDLARPKPGQLARHIRAGNLAQQKLAGGNVERGEGIDLSGSGGRGWRAKKRGEKIIGARIKQRVFGNRARCDKTHDLAPHNRLVPPLFRLRRVFHLLADGDPVLRLDEFLQIFIRRPHRHPAHGDVFAQMLAALGQRDAEGPRGLLRIAEKQLVEITHPVEQQAIGVGRLDLQILRHHRGGFIRRGRTGRSPFCLR
ncbi:hypothetical protein BMS3Bbin10_02151 [bacterium BMS3Bbin10]|nr:hypothetical protein BMS3Bbin10_02151 [bacterium BMS3Bbin10]